MSYFLRCFLRLFHCRTIRRETRVVIGRGHNMKMPNPIGNDDFRVGRSLDGGKV
jgi:hypothetical protein